jgi:4-hydroxyproline epimerase
VTVALERGLAAPREDGVLRLDTPAGLVEATYLRDGAHIESVRIRNIASYLHATDVPVDCPELGTLTVDIAYGGNFYAIVEPQANYGDLADLDPGQILRLSPIVRQRLNETGDYVHPENPTIRGVSHVLWTGRPRDPRAHARNAVFYGEKAIDRSPCGTGTSARMAQLAARGALKPGDDFIHESIIGSLFNGRVEATARVGGRDAIVPSIEGWARITGFNTIFIDDRDPYAHGFQLV